MVSWGVVVKCTNKGFGFRCLINFSLHYVLFDKPCANADKLKKSRNIWHHGGVTNWKKWGRGCLHHAEAPRSEDAVEAGGVMCRGSVLIHTFDYIRVFTMYCATNH